MLTILASAAMAAVLYGNEVAFVQAEPPAVVQRAPLPGRGVALFAAPDARVLVPLARSDATAVVGRDGGVRRWEGRLFPLFFDESDRMLLVVPGFLVTLSYPDRVVLDKVPLDGVTGAWRAACSGDGRLAAIVPVEDRKLLVLSSTRSGGMELRSPLVDAAEVVAVSPTAAWAVVGCADGSLQLVVPGGPTWVGSSGGAGRVTGVAISDDERELVVGLSAGESGEVLVLRVDPKKKEPLRRRSSTVLGAPVLGVALAGDQLFALTTAGVSVFRRGGRKLSGGVELEGGSEIVVLPSVPHTIMPEWSDR